MTGAAAPLSQWPRYCSLSLLFSYTGLQAPWHTRGTQPRRLHVRGLRENSWDKQGFQVKCTASLWESGIRTAVRFISSRRTYMQRHRAVLLGVRVEQRRRVLFPDTDYHATDCGNAIKKENCLVYYNVRTRQLFSVEFMPKELDATSCGAATPAAWQAVATKPKKHGDLCTRRCQECGLIDGEAKGLRAKGHRARADSGRRRTIGRPKLFLLT
jgi:hypothetical protein